MKKWLTAFRLRTLPLALSSISMGAFLAAADGRFSGRVFVWCVLTTVFLQLLSNLANDYGDTVNGADSAARKGPARAVQSGLISLSQMRRAIIIFSTLSLSAGLVLLYVAFGTNWRAFLSFLAVGVAAIFAAIAYTAGRKPYGYQGLGDLSVFLFFGLAGVLGSYYLFAGQFYGQLLLPATSCGLFSVAVLNINNIRDIESDKAAGKQSVPVRLGRRRAEYYHLMLLVAGLLSALLFVYLDYSGWPQLLFLITAPLLIVNGRAVFRHKEADRLDPYLKQMALSTLLFVLLFGIGQLI